MTWKEMMKARFEPETFPIAEEVRLPLDYSNWRWENAVREMMGWCAEQCRDRYRRRLLVAKNEFVLEFERDTDAAMFKLRFGQGRRPSRGRLLQRKAPKRS